MTAVRPEFPAPLALADVEDDARVDAEVVALRALAHVAWTPELRRRLLVRFRARGADLPELVERADVQAEALALLLERPEALDGFCRETGLPPAQVVRARRALRAPDSVP